MQKLLLFILVLMAIYYLRRFLQQGAHDEAEKPAPEQALRPEVMRECEVCGVLAPESECEQVCGRYYCCPEHARQAGAGGQS